MEAKRSNLFAYHSLSEKERKNAAILTLIQKRGPISRTEISHITDVNIVSISNYVKSYIEKKLVVESGYDVSTGGRRPELVEFNPLGGHVIGIEVGQVEIRATVTDLSVKRIAHISADTPRGDNAGTKETTLKVLDELLAASNLQKADIRFVGVGLFSDHGYDIVEAIEEHLHIETLMGTDAACAAYGEKRLNPIADVDDLLYMHSDIGCGIIIRGDIYLGASGGAGDIKRLGEHLAKEEFEMLARDLKYLKPWCIDLGITETARKEIKKGVGTKMVALASGNIENVTKQTVIEAARQNDEIALEIVRDAGINLGIRIAYLVNLFDPEIVVIGGYIDRAGDVILDPIRSAIKKFALANRADQIRVIPSALGEDAVCLGAAALAVREVFLRA